MSFILNPVAGALLNAPVTPYFNNITGGVATAGPQGSIFEANDGRRYIFGVATTPIPAGTTTCAITYTPVASGNGAQTVGVAATGGAFSFAVGLPQGATGYAAAIGDGVWVGTSQLTVGTTP